MDSGGGRGQMHPPFEGLPLCVLSKSVHRAWICTRNSSLVPKTLMYVYKGDLVF